MQKKTIKNVNKLLKPLFTDGKPTIITGKDYIWVHKILSPTDRKAEIYWQGQPVWFDTLRIRVKPKKLKCLLCKKSDGIVKFYSMTNDMLTLKPYHAKCYKNSL